MIKYIKTGTTEFEQFDGSDEMIDKYELIDAGTMLGIHHSPELYLTGSGKVDVGDWIATDVNGEHWPVKDEIFKKTYRKLPVIPQYVADYIENCKLSEVSISEALASEFRPEKMHIWLGLDEEKMKFIKEQYNQRNELVARAWLDGYEVAEVKE